MNRVVLIGGAPTTGKSYIAKKLGEELGLPWISTDQIRTIQKSVAEEDKYSGLFHNLPEDASVDEIVDLEIRRSEIIWDGVLAFAKGHWPWEGCIIEGMAILPHLVVRDFNTAENVKSIFLIHSDDSKIKDLVFERSKQPFIKTKTPSQQERKVEQIKALNEKVYSESSSLGLTHISCQTEKTFPEVIKALS